MRHMLSILTIALLPLGALPVHADKALDLVFDESQLASIETGSSAKYGYSRLSPLDDKYPDIENGAMTLAINNGEQGRTAIVKISDGTRERRLEDFSGEAGNPLIIVFLESISTSVSRGTGGSPFYIRNRVKEAFRAGTEIVEALVSVGDKEVGGNSVTYMPFATEAQTERLGIFADLAVTFVLSDDVPGGILELRARSSGGAGASNGYEEAITFAELVEASE